MRPTPEPRSAAARAISRRRALAWLAAAGAAPFIGACLGEPSGPRGGSPRLTARPGAPTVVGTTGAQAITDGSVTGWCYVPDTIDRAQPAGLMVFLHGADRVVQSVLSAQAPFLDAAGVIGLAPYAASGGSWDALVGAPFAYDPPSIDRLLQWIFARWTIAPTRIGLSGFSDGGTYALALGRANGDLFARLAAYSPGGLLATETVGRPPILLTHGTLDAVIPIAASRDVTVPSLLQSGYTVDYREFAGGHTIPLTAAEDFITALSDAP